MQESNNIALYAAVKTLHTDGHDMWSAVSSLTLLVIPESARLEDIKTAFKETYQLEIPLDALKTIITRLTREGCVQSRQNIVSLRSSGKTAKTALNNSVKDVKREYVALSEDFKNFLKSQGLKNYKSVNTALLDFIDDNIGFATELVTAQKRKQQVTVPASAVADYIIHVEKTNPTSFELLQNIFFGRLYLSLIKTRTELDINAKFDSLAVYLDTNVLLSLLELKDEVINKSAIEMLGVLRSYEGSIKVCVFDATINETLLVLNSYASSQNAYTENLKVDSVHYRMRLRKMDVHDLRLLIENLATKIEDLGIDIIKEPAIDEKKLDITISELSTISSSLNQDKNTKALKHDATAVESIRQSRGTSKTRLLEKCKAILVTQDKSVHVFARNVSSEDSSFPIAIRPVDIISLLWIKMLGSDQGSGNVSLLRNAVMGYARERLINYQLWDNFVERLEEAQQKGDISREDVGLILASDETEKLLITNNQKVVGKIVDQKYVKRLRAEREQLANKSVSDSKNLELISTSLTKTRKELEETASQEKKAQAKITKNERIIEAVKKNILKMAIIVSGIVSIFIWLVITTVVYASVYFLLRIFGVEKLSSLIAVAVVVLSYTVTLLFGQSFKPTELVVKLRNKIFYVVRDKILGFLTRKLMG